MSRKINVTLNKPPAVHGGLPPCLSTSHTLQTFKKIVFLSMFRFILGLTPCTVVKKNAYSFRCLVHDAVVHDWNQTKSILSSIIGRFFTKISGYASVYTIFFFSSRRYKKKTNIPMQLAHPDLSNVSLGGTCLTN